LASLICYYKCNVTFHNLENISFNHMKCSCHIFINSSLTMRDFWNENI
jgi:hypothetical protein